MSRVQLLVDNVVVYDNLPNVQPGPETPAPVVTNADALVVNGQPYDVPAGDSSRPMPVDGGRIYLLTTAEMYKPVTVSVTRPDGSSPWPAVSDNGGHAYFRFQALDTETVTVHVNAEQAGHIERQES